MKYLPGDMNDRQKGDQIQVSWSINQTFLGMVNATLPNCFLEADGVVKVVRVSNCMNTSDTEETIIYSAPLWFRLCVAGMAMINGKS